MAKSKRKDNNHSQHLGFPMSKSFNIGTVADIGKEFRLAV